VIVIVGEKNAEPPSAYSETVTLSVSVVAFVITEFDGTVPETYVFDPTMPDEVGAMFVKNRPPMIAPVVI
jgi:hypothetical protein